MTNYVTLTNAAEPTSSSATVSASCSLTSQQMQDNSVVFAPNGYFTSTNSSGVWTLELLPTDTAGVSPTGWWWTITIQEHGAPTLTYEVFFSYSNGALQDISSLITAPVNPPQVTAAELTAVSTAEATDATNIANIPSTKTTWTADQYFKSGRPVFDVCAFGADPTGTNDSTAAFNAAIAASMPTTNPLTRTGFSLGPVFIPAGLYKITSDINIVSTTGFKLIGAGHDMVRIAPEGQGFTNAVIYVNGALDATFAGFRIQGNGTEGTASGTSPGIPSAFQLTWTGSGDSARSTSGCLLENIRVSSTNCVTGINLAGSGNLQMDGITCRNVNVGGQGLTGSSPATWSNSGNGLNGFLIGSGTYANIYNMWFQSCSVSGCYYGYNCQASGYSLYGAEPAENYIDFFFNGAIDSVNIQSVDSQNSRQFIVCSGSAIAPISFKNCTFSGSYGFLGSSVTANWCNTGTSYGNWVFENIQIGAGEYQGASVSPYMQLDSANYNACFTLINVSQNNPPATGIVPGTGGVKVVCINYQDTTAGGGPSAVLYPFLLWNAQLQAMSGLTGATQGYRIVGATTSGAPVSGTWSAGDVCIDQSGAIWVYNGSAWNGGVTSPTINLYTSASSTWTKPSGAKTVDIMLLGDGAGGGSGAQGAVNSAVCGGGGGGGGAYMERQFVASDLDATLTVTVGQGGAGGAAQTTATTAGNNGIAGTGTYIQGNTTGKVYLYAGAGSRGFGGGLASAGAGGAGGAPALGAGGAGASSSASGSNGVGVNAAAGAVGGPAGGGITTGNVAGNGAAGSYSVMSGSSSSYYGTGGTAGGANPTSGVAPAPQGSPGGSPGSGAASTTTTGQNGANAYSGGGAGGAGGGASNNGSNSGAGGNGGSGFALIITHYA